MIPHGVPTSVIIQYFLHRPDSDEDCLTGASVILTAGLCLPLDVCPCPNTNLFQHLFGIEFDSRWDICVLCVFCNCSIAVLIMVLLYLTAALQFADSFFGDCNSAA